MTDVVILRRWRAAPRSVIALFPAMPGEHGRINSYEHVGQHGEADYLRVVAQTEPVDVGDPEAQDLLAELRAIGYDTLVRRRRAGDSGDYRQGPR